MGSILLNERENFSQTNTSQSYFIESACSEVTSENGPKLETPKNDLVCHCDSSSGKCPVGFQFSGIKINLIFCRTTEPQ
jgi:hypothetical protein